MSIREAIDNQNIADVKRLIHKLNGACCYTGATNLSAVTKQLETQLKIGSNIKSLEPEFLEFFEHIELVTTAAPEILNTIENCDS
jgi:two-component system sensor histidine kinase BarA